MADKLLKTLNFNDGNNYILAPDAVNVTQDAAHRFVTDAEKVKWDGKAEKSDIPTDYIPATVISGTSKEYDVKGGIKAQTINAGELIAVSSIAETFLIGEAETVAGLSSSGEPEENIFLIGYIGERIGFIPNVESFFGGGFSEPSEAPSVELDASTGNAYFIQNENVSIVKPGQLTSKAYVDSKLPDLTQYYTKAEVDALFKVDSTTLI